MRSQGSRPRRRWHGGCSGIRARQPDRTKVPSVTEQQKGGRWPPFLWLRLVEQRAAGLERPELTGVGSRWVLAHPVDALAEHLALLPAAELGAADGQALAELTGREPIALRSVHGAHQLILPRASSHRWRCQSRCERVLMGFLATR